MVHQALFIHIDEAFVSINGYESNKHHLNMEEQVKLLGEWSSPFTYRVIWALKLKNINFKYIEEDLNNKSALLLQYNPVHKKVPVLVHGGKPVLESVFILEYIDEIWPINPLLPNDPYRRSQARFWVKFIDEKVIAFISKSIYLLILFNLIYFI